MRRALSVLVAHTILGVAAAIKVARHAWNECPRCFGIGIEPNGDPECPPCARCGRTGRRWQ